MQWGEALPISSFLSADSVSLFEVSGEVLSPNHTLLEEVVSGHSDIITTLGERAEVSGTHTHTHTHSSYAHSQLLEGVLRLWREDKGLQAMTNTIQGCFSEDSSDIPLFMDALNCFLKHKLVVRCNEGHCCYVEVALVVECTSLISVCGIVVVMQYDIITTGVHGHWRCAVFSCLPSGRWSPVKGIGGLSHPTHPHTHTYTPTHTHTHTAVC